MSVLISLIIGVLLGSFAGYYGGKIDNMIMWFVNVVWSIPTLLMVIAITLALGKGYWQVFVAVGITMWVEVLDWFVENLFLKKIENILEMEFWVILILELFLNTFFLILLLQLLLFLRTCCCYLDRSRT